MGFCCQSKSSTHTITKDTICMKSVALLLISLLLIPLSTTHAQTPRTIAYDETVTDTLSPSAHHEWEFDAIAGDIVVITLHSTDFAPVLELRDTDRRDFLKDSSPIGGNARIITTVPNHGRYVIYVHNQDDTGGDYTLTLTQYPLSDTGSLSYGDTRFSLRSNVEDPTWQFNGRRGDVISIAVNSYAFDPRMTLQGPDGATISADDDGGSNLNAFMVTMLPVDGLYSVVIDSFGGDTGLYFIALDSVSANEILTYGQSIESELDLSGQLFLFEGQLDDLVFMSVSSTAFDPILSVQDSNGLPLAIDDDSGDGNNAQLLMPIYSNGLYIIAIQPFAIDQSGTFTVSIDRVSLSDPTHLSSGDVINAGLTDVAAAYWTFDGQAGLPIDIALTSYGFDTILELTSPADNIIATDRNRGTSNTAHILTILPADGQYTLLVRSLSLTGTLGAYTVSFDSDVSTTPLTIGDSITGDLAIGNNLFIFDGRNGQSIAVSLESDTFDPMLDIFSPDGNLLITDDDSGEGLNAALTTQLPADGNYYLIVRSVDESTDGNYYLIVRSVDESTYGDFTLTLTTAD
jgi:hypothetical protein